MIIWLTVALLFKKYKEKSPRGSIAQTILRNSASHAPKARQSTVETPKASRVLGVDFLKLKILTAGTLERSVFHHRVKFRGDQNTVYCDFSRFFLLKCRLDGRTFNFINRELNKILQFNV